MGRAKDDSRKIRARRRLWLLVLGVASAGAIQAGGFVENEVEAADAPEAPLPLDPAPGEGADPDARPGRDDPEEFYKPPPRPQKRITKLPA